MKTDKEKELDKIFREGLNNPTRSANFREGDWDAMEALLDKNKKRGIIYWLPYIGSVAAMLLIALAWFFMRTGGGNNSGNIAGNTTKPPVYSGSGIQKQTGTDGIVKQQTASQAIVAATKLNRPDTVSPGVKFSHVAAVNKTAIKYAVNGTYISKHRNKPGILNGHNVDTITGKTNLAGNSPLNLNNQLLTANMPQLEVTPIDGVVNGGNGLPVIAKVMPDVKDGYKPTIKNHNTNRTLFAITILAAPDINGVGSFQNSQVGTNAGLLFSVGVTKKFTISTGAMYSKKPYLTDFDNYQSTYAFKTDPINVSADCRVLDIPLNVDYLLYSRAKNSFSIGSGLSSYFMLRENYHYNYATPPAYGPTDYDIANKNRYFFGVLNLDATYQHRLNSKLSVDIEPYLKLPLTDIGAGQVKLQSTGMAIGFTWNLSSQKP